MRIVTNYSGNRTAEPFLAPEAGKQCGHSARQTERGLVGAASASKGFQRFGSRDQKATAIWLQSWDGEKNYLPKVSALLERSDLTHKLPSSSELFLWFRDCRNQRGNKVAARLSHECPQKHAADICGPLSGRRQGAPGGPHDGFRSQPPQRAQRGLATGSHSCSHKTSGLSGRFSYAAKHTGPPGCGHRPAGTSRPHVGPHRPRMDHACSIVFLKPQEH